jgi:ribonuclease HI
MELMAAIEALNIIPNGADVVILTDSSYVVMVGNAKRRTVPHKNSDLWEILRGHQRRLSSLRLTGSSSPFRPANRRKLASERRTTAR